MIENVVKRDGRLEKFNPMKIEKAVSAAFTSVGRKLPDKVIESFVNQVIEGLPDPCGVEEIQNKVENELMRRNCFSVAKAYILYREKHKTIRDYADKNIAFIDNFIKSDNTANATIDDNSNVSNHNIAVLNAELHKEDNQKINYRLLEGAIRNRYPDFDYKQMEKDFNSIMYLHDSSSQVGMPYCVAVTMYPFLLNGIKDLGGLSAKPNSLESFCGIFINMVFAISAQFKGAIATPSVFISMDHFCRKEWGDDYYRNADVSINSDICNRKRTIKEQILQYFQQITYSINQPASARGGQSVFWNVSIFDKEFYDTMYGDFRYPDGTAPQWESFNWLQKLYMHWLNQERLKCILTFPVLSVALIYKEGEFVDKELYEYTCKEYAEGNSFFTYINDSPESLSSCCRLSSKLSKPQFNFTNGQIGEMTGSKNVITLNLSRIVQDWYSSINSPNPFSWNEYKDCFKEYLCTILDRVYKYQTAYNDCLMKLYDAGLLTVYTAGFIDLKKQYLTIGINGLNQAAEFLGMECNKNDQYEQFCNYIFSTIKEQNTLHKTKDLMFNTEFTPCESAAIKMYNRDKKDGYWVPEDTNLYASYIYKPNDTHISLLDKLYLHGRSFCGDNLDGGSAAHLNLEKHLSYEQYLKILKYAGDVGCKYLTFNVVNSECENCHYIAKEPFDVCPKCGSKKVSHYDRVIGYLTKIANWSKGRQEEQKTRVYEKI